VFTIKKNNHLLGANSQHQRKTDAFYRKEGEGGAFYWRMKEAESVKKKLRPERLNRQQMPRWKRTGGSGGLVSAKLEPLSHHCGGRLEGRPYLSTIDCPKER